ncbi:MAG: hypothetical protein ABIO04_01280 [Ferruginibacter sp.]
MKLLFILIVFATTFISCEKNEAKKLCPVVTTDYLPKVIITAFQQKYPTATANKWFNKDNKSYCALVIINGEKKLIEFDNIGNFIKEEIVTEQEGDHQDDGDDDDDNECECETD